MKRVEGDEEGAVRLFDNAVGSAGIRTSGALPAEYIKKNRAGESPASTRVWYVLKRELQDVARQILVFDNVSEHLAHVVAIHRDLLALFFWGFEADHVQHALHDGM
jgi:hypothetical protein